MRLAVAVAIVLSTVLAAACGEAPDPVPKSPMDAPTADPVVVRLEIDGMHCESCVNAITRMLEKVDGVLAATVDRETRRATVIVNPCTPPGSLVGAIRGGYVARVAPVPGDE